MTEYEFDYEAANKRLRRDIKQENIWLGVVIVGLIVGVALLGMWLFSAP